MATAPVKFFHSEIPGAPVLSGTAGSLIAVLDACLVNGWGLITAQSASVNGGVCTLAFATGHVFQPLIVALVAGAGTAAINGEQRVTATTTNTVSFPAPNVPDGPVTGTVTIKVAPAGWVKLFSGVNKAVYKPAPADASGCVVRIDDTAARYARMRAYESMTDVDTGIGPTPTDAQLSGGLYIPKSPEANATARRWVVAASDRFVHFAATSGAAQYPEDYASVAFGDFPSLKAGDAYNFIVVGDTIDTSGIGSPGYNNSLHKAYGFNGAYVVRSYVQSGGAIPAYLYKPGMMGDVWSGSPSSAAGPNPISNTIDICPTLFLEGASYNGNRRGEIPGLYGIPHNLGTGFDNRQQLTPAIGLPGHVLITLRIGGYPTVSQSARFALDITGPWA